MVTSKLLYLQAYYQYSGQKERRAKRQKEKGERMMEAVEWVFIYKGLGSNSKVWDRSMNLGIIGV